MPIPNKDISVPEPTIKEVRRQKITLWLECTDSIYDVYYSKYSYYDRNEFNKTYLSKEFEELRQGDYKIYMRHSYELIKRLDISYKYIDELNDIFSKLKNRPDIIDLKSRIIQIINASELDQVIDNINAIL